MILGIVKRLLPILLPPHMPGIQTGSGLLFRLLVMTVVELRKSGYY